MDGERFVAQVRLRRDDVRNSREIQSRRHSTMSWRSRRILLTLLVLSACLVFTIPQAGTSAPYGRVTEMRLTASPNDWNGGCPVTINFHGFIKVDGPNTVIYAIHRSDGGGGEGKQTLHFAGAGSKAVHFTWKLGAPGENFRGWAQIGSGNTRSDKAEFQIHCRR